MKGKVFFLAENGSGVEGGVEMTYANYVRYK
jgi:hypothetical protein